MIKEKLMEDLELLKRQYEWLEYSYEKCNKIDINTPFSPEELESFETLCSRYSRGIDFLIRKIFRTIDEYEFENQGTLIDVVNNAHKRGLISSVEEIREMKDLRNTIAHEYITINLKDIFFEVLESTAALSDIFKSTIDYISKI